MIQTFKVGNTVRCVEGGNKGAGWQLGLIFKIDRIEGYSDYKGERDNICWLGKDKCGVFSSSLVLNKNLNGD